MHGKISTTQIYVTTERQNSVRYKSTSPSEFQHLNDLQWKINCGKEFYNKIAEEVVF